jgi:peptidoglycan hydrolase-like protein with peptidoglycan-binding domain
MASRDENWATSRQHLIDAANAAGIDPGIMAKIAGFESGFDSGARPIARDPSRNGETQWDGRPAMSTAYGYGQFLDATWLIMINRYGEQYGIEGAGQMTRAQANAPEIRNNPQLQAAMLAEFTRENIERGARLGGPDADANVYAMHNLGEGDATTFLNALRSNPNQPVSDVLSNGVIRNNPSLYGNGSISVSEAYARMGQQMDNYQRYADDALGQQTNPGVTPPAGSQPAGSTPDSPTTTESRTPPSATTSAMADGVLRERDRGTEVRDLQQQLNQLGYTDQNGRQLAIDGDFGQRTRQAVEAFQRAQGLPVDGIVGPQTIEALGKAQSTTLLSNPNHPDHTLYAQALKGMEALPAGTFSSDQDRQRAAASVAFEAKVSGLSQIDNVVLSRDGSGLFAVQGAMNDPAHQRVYVDKQQAASQPVERTTAQIDQETKDQSQQPVAPSRTQEPRVHTV